MKLYSLLFSLILSLFSFAQETKVVVICNPKSTYTYNTDKIIRDAWLLKTKIGKNLYALPVNKQVNSLDAIVFYKKILNLSTSQVKNHFFSKQYSDAIMPPVILDSDDAIINYVNSNPTGLGYVNLSAINSDNSEKVKIICIIDGDKITFH